MNYLKKVVLCLLILVSAFLQIKSPQKFSTVNDLCQDYLSVSWLHQKQPAYQIFSHTQCHIRSKLLPSQYNAHPPTSLIFFYPLSYLSLSEATLYWDIFSVLLYFLSLVLLLIIAKQFSFPKLAFFFSLSTLWITLNINYAVRNLSILILFLTALTVSLIISKKYRWAGFIVGLAVLIKVWPLIFFLPVYLNKSYGKYLFTGLISVIAGIFITYSLFGPRTFMDYSQKVIPFEQIFSNFVNNNSLVSTFYKLKMGIAPRGYPPLL